jgi:hypothetical protein
MNFCNQTVLELAITANDPPNYELIRFLANRSNTSVHMEANKNDTTFLKVRDLGLQKIPKLVYINGGISRRTK